MLRSISLILACILVYPTVAESEFIVFTSGNFQGLRNSHGEVIIPPVYDVLGWSDGTQHIRNEMIGFNERGKWGLISIRNRRLTNPLFILLEPFTDGLFEGAVKNSYSNHLHHGLIDASGRTIVDFQFFDIEPLKGNKVLVSRYEQGKIRKGVWDVEVGPFVPMEYLEVLQVGELWMCSVSREIHHLYGANGERIVMNDVESVERIGSDYHVRHKGKVGIWNGQSYLDDWIRFKGFDDRGLPVTFPKWVITEVDGNKYNELWCDSLELSPDGELVIAHVNNTQHFLNQGKEIFPNQEYRLKQIEKGFIILQSRLDGKWGIFRTNGSALETGLDSVGYDDSYFYVRRHDGWFIYNFFGRKLNEFPFSEVSWSSGRNVPVKRNGYWGWIDFQGDQLINFKFDSVVTTMEGTFLAKFLGKWGVLNVHEQWIIMPEYERLLYKSPLYISVGAMSSLIFDESGKSLNAVPHLADIIDDQVVLLDSGRVGAIFHSGKALLPIYDSLQVVGDHLVMYLNDSVEIYNRMGVKIIAREDEIRKVVGFSEDYFLVIKDGKYGFIDKQGKLRIANRYEGAQIYSEGNAAVLLKGKWGFIDKYERLVIQPYYDRVSHFKNELAIVSAGEGAWGLVDKDGQERIGMNYQEISRLKTGNYLLKDQKGHYGLANGVGKIILRTAYDRIEDTDENLIIVESDGRKGVVNYQGASAIPLQYKDIRIHNGYILMLKDETN